MNRQELAEIRAMKPRDRLQDLRNRLYDLGTSSLPPADVEWLSELVLTLMHQAAVLAEMVEDRDDVVAGHVRWQNAMILALHAELSAQAAHDLITEACKGGK